MARRSRRWWILFVCLVIESMSWGTVSAADKTNVDHATAQVDQGARQIGQGRIGSGFKEMFTGIGHTIVEGAKFSGYTMQEFFKKAIRG